MNVPDWRGIAAKARSASLLLRRNHVEGERQFETLFGAYGRDPFLFFERGKARADIGDRDGAVSDLTEAAERFPKAEFRQKAADALEGLKAPVRANIQRQRAMELPTRDILSRAHQLFTEREKRWLDYDVAARLLSQALEGTHALSVTVPVALLLQSWNFAYYQDGRTFDAAHYIALDRCLMANRSALEVFRARRLESWNDGDRVAAKKLVTDLNAVVGRVGAVKVMHLWAPDFFPLWDTPIAAAYGYDLSSPADHYCEFVATVRRQVEALDSPAGVPPLKALDEFNYCRFTKRWM